MTTKIIAVDGIPTEIQEIPSCCKSITIIETMTKQEFIKQFGGE